MTTTTQETLPPTDDDVRIARESSRRLSELLSADCSEALRVTIRSGDGPEETVAVPVAAFRLLTGILNEMAQGRGVTLMPVRTELTTQQAADLLNVSRPFLIEQLDKGLIPCRKVGTHRRVALQDVLEYRRNMHSRRAQALSELSALDQELGLGY